MTGFKFSPYIARIAARNYMKYPQTEDDALIAASAAAKTKTKH